MLAALVLLSVSSSPPEPVKDGLAPELRSVVEGQSAFALELYSKLKDQGGNLFLSPFSISSAMGMAFGGARGNTEKQIAQVLHFGGDQPSFHSGMRVILAGLTNAEASGGLELRVANGLWPQTDYRLTEDFTTLCRKNYHSEVNFVDFKRDYESARQRISSWVGRLTKGKIKDLFAPGTLSATTRLVIVNAIYFKGAWASRFDKGNTRTRAFWVSPEKAIQAPMMSQKSTFRFLTEGEVQILELPYRGERISMLVLLPRERDGLPGLEQQFTSENLNHWIDGLHFVSVEVLLPKFKMKSRLILNQTLASMGMADAFDGNHADFSGMAAQRPLFIDVVEHSALVEVDEEGTVAAATTGASFGCSKQLPPASFNADHPFIFLIRDKQTGTLLFIGKLDDPRS